MKFNIKLFLLLLLGTFDFAHAKEDLSRFCEYQTLLDKASEQERDVLEEKYLQVVGVLYELDRYRSRYLSGNKEIDVFPAIYYHITAKEMDLIRSGTYQYPMFKLDQMLAFYEAYHVNRMRWDNSRSGVEPHWQGHFKAATDNGFIPCEDLGFALLYGMTAHIKYDLPRSIWHAYFPIASPSVNRGILKSEFLSLNPLFDGALGKGIIDIKKNNPGCGWVFDQGGMVSVSLVKQWREAAWDAAFDAKPIEHEGKPIGKQPRSESFRKRMLEIGQNACNALDLPTLYLFDLSGSMNSRSTSGSTKLQEAQQAAMQSIASLQGGGNRKKTQVGILGFRGACPGPGGDPTTGPLSFTDQLPVVEKQIKGLSAGGGTPLYEAISSAECKLADYLSQNNLQQARLIILSDGQATCKKIRPQGTYNTGGLGQQVIQVDLNSCQAGGTLATRSVASPIKYYTIGLQIGAGSPAERDLQFLAQTTGGKYLSVESQNQLTQAFNKFSKSYSPKLFPLYLDSVGLDYKNFYLGLGYIKEGNYQSAKASFLSCVKDIPGDFFAVYNLALMHEALDEYPQAIERMEEYLSKSKFPTDSVEVIQLIEKYKLAHKQYIAFQKKMLKSDLDYLELHFKKIQNGQSRTLAAEFYGFLKEKVPFYQDFPSRVGEEENVGLTRSSKEVASNLQNCERVLRKNPDTWDRDAIPVLSRTYMSLNRLIMKVD